MSIATKSPASVRSFLASDALVVTIARGVPTENGTIDVLRIRSNATGVEKSYFLNAVSEPETVAGGVVEQMLALKAMRPRNPAPAPAGAPADEVAFA